MRIFRLSGAGQNECPPSSVDQVAAAIAQFEQSTNFKDFRKFHIAQAVAFKGPASRTTSAPKTGRPLAKATIHSRLIGRGRRGGARAVDSVDLPVPESRTVLPAASGMVRLDECDLPPRTERGHSRAGAPPGVGRVGPTSSAGRSPRRSACSTHQLAARPRICLRSARSVSSGSAGALGGAVCGR